MKTNIGSKISGIKCAIDKSTLHDCTIFVWKSLLCMTMSFTHVFWPMLSLYFNYFCRAPNSMQ